MRTLAFMAAAVLGVTVLYSQEDAPKIMRPVDGAALTSGAVDVIASATDGVIEIDGKAIEVERPYPAVLRAKPKLADGQHTIGLVTKEARKEIRIFVGAGAPPSGFAAFREHPPIPDVACTQCHEVNRRGRFRFKGEGCFDCHQQDGFAKVHTHLPDTLSQCGSCHNAHGSTVKAHLTLPKDAACRQCHN